MVLTCLAVVLMCYHHVTVASFYINTCCSDPVKAFVLREFDGSCACQTLQQKWRRYTDWIGLKGGYIHPWVELHYAHEFSVSEQYLNLYSKERGVFVNIPNDEEIEMIEPHTLLMQIPFAATLSQPLISRYIRSTEPALNPILRKLLPKPSIFFPYAFPDWKQYLQQTGSDSIAGWLSLGAAWLKQNTNELLPWFELLPTSNYLPLQWDDDEREHLLHGTQALKLLKADALNELQSAASYMKMLGVTETQVRYMMALLQSRAFTLNLNDVEGDMIPAGFDFFNDDRDVLDEVYYDSSMENATKTTRIVLENRDVESVNDVDFASMFFIMHDFVYNASEIFMNYGHHLNTATRMAHFGFMNKEHPEDHYSLAIDIKKDDINYDFKMKYFDTMWIPRSWRKNMDGLSPLFMFNYDGKIQPIVHESTLQMLRLLGLSSKHFDSFTINSILNHVEYDYLQNVIDPQFHEHLHQLCMDALQEFKTSQYVDHLLLGQTEQQRQYILDLMESNANKNWTESERLGNSLAAIERRNLAIRYRIKEKHFLNQCTRVTLLPMQRYLMRRKRHNKL